MNHWLHDFLFCAIGCLLLAASCNSPNRVGGVKHSMPDNKIDRDINPRNHPERTGITISQIDTLVNEGLTFRVVRFEQGFLSIVIGVDTVFNWMQTTNGFDVVDFDGDGNQDVLIHYITNVPNIHDLLLYIPARHQFAPVKGFDTFPSPERVKGTPYFYSYHRAGCADENWASDLFSINGDSTICLGNIEGHGCDSDSTQWIAVSRIEPGVSRDVMIPMDTLPISSIDRYFD